MKNIIYKYFRINQYLYDTLVSNQLYFSSIEQFNDPYDCHLALLDKVSEEDFNVFILKTIKNPEFQSKYLKAFRRNPDEFVKPFIEMYIGSLKYMGICCFTKSKENILLWSHYADSHKGVCLGFDYDILKKNFPQYDDVDYNDEPFYFDIKNGSESIGKTALRKSSDWKYEDEVRFFMERRKSVSFYHDALLEVNFGSRCKSRDMLNVQHLISKFSYPNCNFYQSTINQKKYSVEFQDLDIERLTKEVLKDSESKPYSHSVNLERLLE